MGRAWEVVVQVQSQTSTVPARAVSDSLSDRSSDRVTVRSRQSAGEAMAVLVISNIMIIVIISQAA